MIFFCNVNNELVLQALAIIILSAVHGAYYLRTQESSTCLSKVVTKAALRFFSKKHIMEIYYFKKHGKQSKEKENMSLFRKPEVFFSLSHITFYLKSENFALFPCFIYSL